jgi:membrane peptidoglycan carboxypeptidase
MASAYGTLATGGRHVHPLPVVRIADADGDLIWEAQPKPKQVVEPQVAADAADILQDVVTVGTGTAATIGRPQIGKTGTDEDHANAWFVGAVPQLAAAVWVGYLEGEVPMEPPRTRLTVFGGTWPAQIWRLTMLRATAGMPVMGFPTPSVDYLTVEVDVTQDPYCLPNRYTLPQNIETLRFIQGTEPLDECTQPDGVQRVIVPSTVGFLQLDAMTQLREAGFYVEVELVDSTQPPGTVVYQNPPGGTSETQTSTVRLSVAQPPQG